MSVSGRATSSIALCVLCALCAVCALLALAVPCGAASRAGGPPSVLVLEQEPHSWPAPRAFLDAFRRELQRDPGESVLLYDESLDETRFGGPDYTAGLRDWLREKYRGRSIDVVVASGQQSLRFVLDHQQEIWPHAAVVVAGVDADHLAQIAPARAITGRTRIAPVRPTLEIARALLPRTQRIAIVSGAASRADTVDRVAAARQVARDGGLEVIDLVGLSIAETELRVAALPENTVVYYAGIVKDGAGESFVPRDALRRVTRRANRPVFSDVETHLGAGTVGGYLLRPAGHGVETAALVRRILDGEKAADLPLAPSEAARPGFDARQLERWRLPLDRIPAGSDVVFRQPSLWQSHHRWVVGTAALLAVQGLLIAGLLVERRARRRSDVARQQTMNQLAHLNRVAALGEMSSVLAHEINQPLAAILGNAQAALRMLRAPSPDLAEIAESLDDIVVDDQRAGQVIRQMRTLLRRGEPQLQPLRLNTLVREVVALVSRGARARQVELDLDLAPDLPVVPGDPVQIQQVVLNLLANALDAVSDAEVGMQRVLVRTCRPARDVVELSVTDSGRGIAASDRERVFEPFVSTKPSGLGVGLGISRSIVEAHGGRIWAESGAEAGATFRCRLPAAPRAEA